MASVCSDDANFGPSSSCRHMDFTLGFQYRIMSVVPSCVLIFCCVLRVPILYFAPRITKNAIDLLSFVKLVGGILLASSLAATVALVPREEWGEWATIAYALEITAAICLVALSYLHHTRCLAPSILIGLYLLASILFSATQLRSYLAISTIKHADFFPPFVLSLASRICLLLVEFVHKRRLLKNDDKPTALEPTSSLPSRLSFVFLYPVLIGGFTRAYDLDDLCVFGLPPALAAAPANAALTKALSKANRKDPKAKQSLFGPSMRAFWVHFWAPAIPKLLLIASTFAQPYLVSSMVQFVDSYNTEGASPQDPAHGWGLVGAYAIVYLSIASCTALYWDKVYTMVVRYRAALVSVIFDKSMRLSASVAESEGRGTAVTYMSVDVERVCEGVAFFHEVWTSMISIAVAAVVLWFQASFAMIPPICIMFAFFFITSYIGKRVAGAQKRWMGSTQARVKVLTSIMSQIIPVKLLAVEDTTAKWVTPLRVKEIDHLKKFFQKLVIVGVLSSATVNFAGISALGTYVGLSPEELRPETLFTILTVVNLVTLPISAVGNCVPLLLASYASMKRIASFLSLEEKTENTNPVILHQRFASDYEHEKLPPSEASTSSLTTVGKDKIALSHATVAVAPDGKALLSDCTVTFLPNNLSMVVGPVGSGKSILLKALLSETVLLSGSATLPHRSARIAYAPQEAFLWPTTVRENIVLDGKFDMEWYQTVIEACCLIPDLQRMENEDMTVVGGSGRSVSGGQRQRISLARAVYAKCDVTLLDDCFSALDSHTSSAIFSRLFTDDDALLRARTVILVTQNQKHISSADHVVVLDGGAVVAQGSLSELHANQLDMTKYVGEEKEDVPSDDVVEESKNAAKDAKPKTASKGTATGTGKAGKAVTDEEMKGVRGSSSWAPYLYYLRACGWNRLSICFVCLVIYTGLQIGLQILLKEWSESNTTNHGPWLGGYAAFTVACFTAFFITLWMFTQNTAPHASLVIHASQLDAVLGAPVTYFQRTPLAKLQNRWSSDMFTADFTFPRALQDFTFTAVYIVGAIILILIAVPWLAISIPFIGGAYWGLQRVYLATSRQLQRLTMSSKTPLYTAFTTTLTGLVTIRAFRAEKLFKDMSAYHLDRSQVPMYYRYAGIRFLRTSLNFITAIIAIGIAALAVGLRGSTSSGYLGVALSQLVGLATSLINLLFAYTRVENGMISVERVFELDNVAGEGMEGSSPPKDPGPQWPARGEIEFRNVELRYSKDLENVLHSISFTVKGGEKLGICGRTGSGKSSTVFALLQGLGSSTELVSGQIFIDGVDVSTVPVGTLRSSISTVSQDPFLLFATMRDNLTLGCSGIVTDEQIWEALDLVGMRGSIENLDTMMTADGLGFSAGERQLLCIARVLLQKRKIVILDEASSSMDNATDQRLLSVLRTSLRDVTVISVAHRIATIVDYDQVFVMENGRIVEMGEPKALLETENSEFASLYKNQTA